MNMRECGQTLHTTNSNSNIYFKADISTLLARGWYYDITHKTIKLRVKSISILPDNIWTLS